MRLVVEDGQGCIVEDRVTVEVGRVVTNLEGGVVVSTDGRVILRIKAWSAP